MNWKKIRNEYETTNITLKALAEKYSIKIGTLKSRKSREGWNRNATLKKDAKKKKVATHKKDAMPQPVILSEELTEKQKLFCLYYTKYYNATKAYQKAYDCAYTTAMVNGSGLLRNTKVKAEIDRLKAEQQQGLFLDGMAVLQKYIDIAFADISDFIQFGQKEDPVLNVLTGDQVIDENGEPVTRKYNFVDVMNSDQVDGTLITEIKQGKEGISIKLADKMKALEMLTKYFDLIPETFKRRIEEERLNLSKDKVELEKRIVKLREEEAKLKGW
jgi:phage terminase small subunit